MKLAFIGDIAFIGKFDISKNSNVLLILKPLAEKLGEYDYVIGNLESPLTNETKSLVCKSMHLKANTKNIELLNYLNINAVSLANNHIYDYGRKGVEKTIKMLKANNIEYFGINGKTISKNFYGQNISVSGFCCFSTNGIGYAKKLGDKGVNLLTRCNIKNQLTNDKKHGDFSILSMHWGQEHTHYPNFEHVRLSEKIVKQNNVVVAGHHPHVIQGVKAIDNSVVAYSLGNCLFDDCTSKNGKFKVIQNNENKTSFILEVNIEDNKIKYTKYHGYVIDNSEIRFFDINGEIKRISLPLENIENKDEYNNIRLEKINKITKDKFGEKNFKWFLSRLNYYSIGAYILGKYRALKYRKVKKEFESSESV